MRRSMMDSRAAVLLARYEEEKSSNPSEAVLAVCDLFLALTEDDYRKMHIELSQPSEVRFT